MKVTHRPSLASLNTFGVAARAQLLLEIETEEDVLSMPFFNSASDLILGGGSNVLFVNDVPGTVLLNRIAGIEVIEQDDQHVLVEAGAGENWHKLVKYCVQKGWSGIENLALIPGLAGAAPIQNIGAYGAELATVLDSVTAWDMKTATWAVLDKNLCRFEYRDSLFKSIEPSRYFITSISLRLNKEFAPLLGYAGLQEILSAAGIQHPTPIDVCLAVERLRQSKLPDPAVQGNAGSFFKNPVISTDQLEVLHNRFPALPSWAMDEALVKISAAWMIEQCKLKGLDHNGAAVSLRHALVLVNQGHATGQAVWQLAQRVQKAVSDRFGIMLEPEPLIYQQPEEVN